MKSKNSEKTYFLKIVALLVFAFLLIYSVFGEYNFVYAQSGLSQEPQDTYLLQYNKVMDIYGNWTDSEGF